MNFIFLSCKTRRDKTSFNNTHNYFFNIKFISVLLRVMVKISLIHHYLLSAHWWDTFFFLLRETAGRINFLSDPESGKSQAQLTVKKHSWCSLLCAALCTSDTLHRTRGTSRCCRGTLLMDVQWERDADWEMSNPLMRRGGFNVNWQEGSHTHHIHKHPDLWLSGLINTHRQISNSRHTLIKH